MFEEIIEWFKRFVTAHEKLAEANAVIAQAMAANIINQSPTSVGFIDYGTGGPAPGTPDGTECTCDPTKGEGCTDCPTMTASEVVAAQQPPAAPPSQQPPAEAPTGWNPYTSPVAKQYRAEKQDILKRELAKLGLDPGAKMTGAQMHELLLDKAKLGQNIMAAPPAAPVAPVAPVAPMAPAAPVAPAAPSAPTLTMPGAPVVPVAPVNAEPAPVGIDFELVKKTVYDVYNVNPAEALRLLQEIGGTNCLADKETQAPMVPQDKWLPLYNAAIAALGRA